MKLGLVTYNLARDWMLPELLERCEETGFEGVELRTTHAHGVETDLTAEERQEVRRLFEKSPVALVGLGSAFEFHSPDPEELQRNISGTMDYVRLAAELGCPGVKVRPNALMEDEGVPVEDTLRQIGESLRKCGEFAKGFGVEIRLEVHGRETSRVEHIQRIMEHADHDNVFVCWNSNQTDVENGSVLRNFERVADKVRLVHMRDLCLRDYPWVELFRLLTAHNYDGYCLAEIAGSADAARVMLYYRALWDAYLELARTRQD